MGIVTGYFLKCLYFSRRRIQFQIADFKLQIEEREDKKSDTGTRRRRDEAIRG
jgi:hypothetical protein